MSDLDNKRLWAIVGVGLTIRVALAFAFCGTNHVLMDQTHPVGATSGIFEY